MVQQAFAGVGPVPGRPPVPALAAAGAGVPAAGGARYDVTVNVSVPGGFIGSPAQFATELAPVVQRAILQLERRNPTPQTSLPG